MRHSDTGRTAAEVIVVGSGVAGLSAALSLRPHRVLLLTKTQLGEGSSSVWAQGGVAVALGQEDSPALHAQDTLAVGGGIAEPAAVAVLTQEGPASVRRLMELGAHFDTTAHGLTLGREAAHSQARIVHAQGDATGAEMIRALRQAVRQAAWITVLEDTAIEDLVLQQQHVYGVIARHRDQSLQVYTAAAVVLATGGAGQLFRYTTNPPEATADGLAIAARAGARLGDLEFVQFHPTALATGSDPLPLVTEALRGAGAILVNSVGQRFMVDAHPGAELAPRDCVAREIWRQLQAGHTVYLDARSAIGQHFPVRFPTVFAHCQQQGLDPRQDLLPVVPAAHYHMGGIAVDICGRASLSNLWACGEVACTGVHGANRLASNSLLEALVFGQRVGEDIQRCLQPYHPHHQVARTLARQQRCRLSPEAENALRQQLRTLMWEHVGLVRTEAGLRTAQQTLQNLASHYQPQAGEVRNLLTVARLVTTAALWRRESRGAHFRADYPAMERRWQHHSLWSTSDLESEAQRGATAAFSMPRARRPGGAPRYDQATVS